MLTARIFILEGLATVALVPVLYFVLPDYPSTTKWLTAKEKDAVIASRAQRGAADKAHFDIGYLKTALKRESIACMGSCQS